jgi:hypothetical protein
MSMKLKNWQQISPLSLIVVPVKQHLGCCLVLPLFLKLFAATALAEFLGRAPYAELLLAAILLPPAIYLCLKLEDWWKARSHPKKPACHTACCPPRPDQAHFVRRFVINLVVGAAILFVVHYFLHVHAYQKVEISQDYQK